MATQAMVLVAPDGATVTYQPQRSPRPFPSAGVFAELGTPLRDEALRDAVALNAIRSLLPSVQTVAGFQAFLHPDQIGARKRTDFFLEADGYLALRLITLLRKVPAGIEKRLLDQRIAEFVAREGRQPLEKELTDLKHEVTAQLLPRAPIAEIDQLLIFNRTRTRLFLEVPTLKRAEETAGALRARFGSFPIRPLQHETPTQQRMTGWLAGSPMPAGLVLGQRAALQDSAKSTAALRNHSLDSEEVKEHLLAGKQAMSVGVRWRDEFSALYTAHNLFTGLRMEAAIKPSVKPEQMTLTDLRTVFGLGARALFDCADALFGREGPSSYQPPDEATPATAPRGLPGYVARALPAPARTAPRQLPAPHEDITDVEEPAA
jgi:hypothetical protein